MKRFVFTAGLAIVVALGSLATSSTPAEARRSGLVAGLVLGAVIGGLVAREYRQKRHRSYYYSTYRRHYDFAPARYTYRPVYYRPSYHRSYRYNY